MAGFLSTVVFVVISLNKCYSVLHEKDERRTFDKDMKLGAIGVIFTLITVCRALPYGESHIARINEQGRIIEGPYESGYLGFYGFYSSESRVCEDGYIYFCGRGYDRDTLYCYSPTLTFISSRDGGNSYHTIPLDNVRSSVFVTSEQGESYYIDVLSLTLDPKYSFEVPVSPVSITVDENDGSIWVTETYGGGEGLYKYDETGDLMYYFPEYEDISGLSNVIADGSFWATYSFVGYPDYITKIRKHAQDGSFTAETYNASGYSQGLDMAEIDGSIWLITYESELMKIDRFGNIIFRYTGIEDIRSLSINQNDGSVWVSSENYDIAHFDANGELLLHYPWFEKYVMDLAFDPSDNSVIVFSTSYLISDIQPSSLGEIKAMFR
ncbi:MAG: hypothetical protein JSW52_12210 [Candidatus Coatesbacteria bacterium]|nr:MAG: hypothetical protein JSW52_12210 [Candidatus Coatesbacteria bacterium]